MFCMQDFQNILAKYKEHEVQGNTNEMTQYITREDNKIILCLSKYRALSKKNKGKKPTTANILRSILIPRPLSLNLGHVFIKESSGKSTQRQRESPQPRFGKSRVFPARSRLLIAFVQCFLLVSEIL